MSMGNYEIIELVCFFSYVGNGIFFSKQGRVLGGIPHIKIS
jgi:hypothetical protein